MNFFKKVGIPVALSLLLGAGSAVATPVDDLLTGTGDVIEDDDAETVFRANNTGGFSVVTTGELQIGDVIVGIIDFPIVNGVELSTIPDELTGVFALSVENIVIDVAEFDNKSPLGRQGRTTFGSVSVATFEALTLIDVDGQGYDDADAISAFLFEDTANNLNIFTQNFGGAMAAATDGTQQMVLDLNSASSFGAIDFADFVPGPGAVAGVSLRGDFDFDFGVVANNFAFPYTSYIGSGTNVVNGTAAGAVQSDSQAAFVNRVPEPASLALLGIGLLGLAGSRRRRA